MTADDASDDRGHDGSSDATPSANETASEEPTDEATSVESTDETTSKESANEAANEVREPGGVQDTVDEILGGKDGSEDPRKALRSPGDFVPKPEAPRVGSDAPDVPKPDDVPEGLRAEFWELVFAANVALFCVALGAMLVAFRGNVVLGGVSLAVGVLAGAYFFHNYRNREHTP